MYYSKYKRPPHLNPPLQSFKVQAGDKKNESLKKEGTEYLQYETIYTNKENTYTFTAIAYIIHGYINMYIQL